MEVKKKIQPWLRFWSAVIFSLGLLFFGWIGHEVIISGSFSQIITSAYNVLSVTHEKGSVYVASSYGGFLIDEPILVELIQSPAFERLKKVSQYGSNDYGYPTQITYSRYDHCLGVMLLLRKKGADLKTQVAGLLHDISHTAFSHSTDPLFMGGFTQGAYQDASHVDFLKRYGIEKILKKYDLRAEDVVPEHYPMLDVPSPSLCADRLEYNLTGVWVDGSGGWDRNEVEALLKHIHFKDNVWYVDDIEIARRLGLSSIDQTLRRWGSPGAILMGTWTSEILAEALKKNLITVDDIRFYKTDGELWAIFKTSDNPFIIERIQWIEKHRDYFTVVEEDVDGDFDTILYSKFRGLDPHVMVNGKLKRLTEVDERYRLAFLEAKKRMEKGWKVKFKGGACLKTSLK